MNLRISSYYMPHDDIQFFAKRKSFENKGD